MNISISLLPLSPSACDMEDRYLRLANFLQTVAVAMAQVVHHINIVDMYKAHTHNIIRVWFLERPTVVSENEQTHCCMWNQRHVRDQKSPTTKDFWLHQCFLSQKIKTKEKKETWHTSPISQIKDKSQPTQDHTTSQICLNHVFYFKTTHKKNTKKNTSQASALDRNTHNACSSCGWSCFVSRFTSLEGSDSPGDKLCLLVVFDVCWAWRQHMCFLFWGDGFSWWRLFFFIESCSYILYIVWVLREIYEIICIQYANV